jgi:N,N-dimethylformamidase
VAPRTVDRYSDRLPSGRSSTPDASVLGYTTPLIARPGEAVAVRVSSTAPEVTATGVRLRGVDPAGAIRAEPMPGFPDERMFAGEEQGLAVGSSVVVGPSPVLARADAVFAHAWIFPTLLTSLPQVVMGTLDDANGSGWQLVVDRYRGAGLRVGGSDGEVRELYVGGPLRERCWTEISGSVADGALCVREGERTVRAELEAFEWRGHDLLVVGAPHGRRAGVLREGNGCFNGKIADPVVRAGTDASAQVTCRLDFADAIGRRQFTDRSEHGLPAVAVNGPTAGVTGPSWSAAASAFHQARGEYAALHFHDDDLDDAGWEAALEIELPADAARGVYAARLEGGGCVDHVPFFVTDPAAPPRAHIALLLPTLTYLAYANEHEIMSNPSSYRAFTGLDADEAQLGWRDELAVDLGLLSLYDVHRDGSTVVHASTRRPLLNLRPDYRWPLIDGPHGLAVDLALMAWLDDRGLEFDVVCDHDLDAGGAAVLAPYRVLVTGGHPEYWTAAMLNAAEAYLDGGGRLAYLGGNGFYWVTGIDPELRHRMEVRRGFAGSRPSSSAPGEAWLASTGEEGGIWRHRGRAPNRLTGVGFAAMGGGPGLPYRRTEAGRDPRYAFVFEGVEGEEVGVQGTILGGAAAYEIDRADATLGTPDDAVVIATSHGFTELYLPVIEDFVSASPELADPGSAQVRADMVLLARPSGGAVFSVGSAAWCGSVTAGGDDKSAATVTENVLRRFVETPDGAPPLHPDAAELAPS